MYACTHNPNQSHFNQVLENVEAEHRAALARKEQVGSWADGWDKDA